MIEFLKDWVRNLITIVIFANILELLLPDSSMRRYIKVVMGFFILLTILQPLLGILNVDVATFATFDTLVDRKQQQKIMAQGGKLQEENQKLVLQTYEKQLSQQIRALILTQSVIEDVDVKVKSDSQGRILAVQLKLLSEKEVVTQKKSSSGIRPVTEVQIKVGIVTENKQPVKEEVSDTENMEIEKEKISKLLATFYNLKKEAISFQ